MNARAAILTAASLAALSWAVVLPFGDAAAGPGTPTLGLLVYDENDPVELHVPHEYATVQAAVDASRAGDTIFIGPGEYEESLLIENRFGLVLQGAGAKLTTIRSADTVLRIESTPSIHIEGIRFESSAEIAIETNGTGASFRFNVIVSDAPSGRGRIQMQCLQGSEFVRNTFVRPEGATGPFLQLNPDPCAGSAPVIVRRNLFWTWGKPVADYADRAIISENNLGIADPGDYPEENIFAFPLFCRPEVRDYTLGPGSPCLPENNPWGRTIGALGMGCGPVGVEPETWGRIKNGYR